jgi:hypothetical protein
MASLGKIVFKGVSSKKYRFTVYPLGTRFRKLSGVYVITKRSRKAEGPYRHLALYVGHTEDFSQPFGRHRKAKEFRKRGANCICLQSDKSEESRLAKQQDLVAAFHRVCND